MPIMEGEKKPREEEAGLDDVTIQETVESPNSTGWRSWSWTSPRKKAVASEPDLRKHARLWRAASSAKEGHSRVDHDQPRHNSVALAKYINTHTSRLAADRELTKAGVRPVFTYNDPLWNKRWGVVNPRHRYVQYWDLNTLILLVFTCLVTPYEIAYMDGQRGVNVEILFWVNQYINLSFVFDMLIICLSPFEGEDRQWVVDKKEIFWRYLKSMFLIDLMSIAPFDIIERLHAGGQSTDDIGNLKAFRVLKLFRLLKVLRIFRGLRIVREHESDFAVDYQALNISMLLVVLLVTAHWIACLVAIICRYDEASPELEDFFPNLVTQAESPTKLKHYLYAFTWGVQWIATGEGSGHDDSLVSSGMRTFFVFLLIIGAIANAAIIGGVMTIVDEMNLASREFHSNLNALNQYIKSEDVANRQMAWRGTLMPGREFCRRLRKFYIFKFNSVREYHNLHSVLQNVSPDMRMVVADAMYGDVIRGCEVFKNASDELITAIAVGMDVQVFARGDRVYDVGAPATELYWTLKGTVMMPAKETGRGLSLYRKGGEPFGQEVIYRLGAPRARTAVCTSEVVLLAVSGRVIHEAIEQFAETGIRWRVMMTRNILRLSSTMTQAREEVLHGRGGVCDADAGVRYLEERLGKGVLFQQDPARNKANNLLFHLKRLVSEELVKGGCVGSELADKLKSFEPHEATWHASMRKMVEFESKVQDLRSLLNRTVDEENRSMSVWFETLVAERVETIDQVAEMSHTDFKLVGIPLGDAFTIGEAVAKANTLLRDKGVELMSELERTRSGGSPPK